MGLCHHRCNHPIPHTSSCYCTRGSFWVLSPTSGLFEEQWLFSVHAEGEAVVRLHRDGKMHNYFHSDSFPSPWNADTWASSTCHPCCYVLLVVLHAPLFLWSPDLLLYLSPERVLLGVDLLSWSRHPSSCRCLLLCLAARVGQAARAGDPSCAAHRQG